MKRMSFKKLCLLTVLCALSLSVPSYAIFGIGVHYGMDFSLSMKDALNSQLTFDNLSISANPAGFSGLANATGLPTTITGADMPIFIDRTDFGRSPFNLGAKIYVDVIPFIDAIEISGNLGVWEYDGKVRYPTGVTINTPNNLTSLLAMQSQNMLSVTYDTMDLTLKGNGIKIPGITLTPYMKLQTELNIRKYIKIPVIEKIIKPYAGAGFGVHFATPAISTGLINDAIGEVFTAGNAIDLTTGGSSATNLVGLLSSADNQKKIVEELLKRLMTPHYGVGILAGVMVKIPVIPLGIYVDGKFIIPFEAYDKDADIKGTGFMLNAGLALAL
jgi:hypothetical protein